MTDTFDDISNLPVNAEDIESADYVDFELLPVGKYLSSSRTISGKKKDDGTTTFEIKLEGGIQNPATGQVLAANGNPLRTWVSTKKYSLPNRPGQTSSVAQYLRAVGLDPKSITHVGEAMAESQSIPVQVFIGRTNRTEKLADGSYEKEVLKTRDFNMGTKEAPDYAATVTVGGRLFQGRHKVQGFSQVS